MKTPIALALSALLWSSVPAMAATGPTVATLEAESAAVDSYAIGHSTTVENRISGSFVEFSGSPENASAVVTGLRQGSAINLTSTAPDGSVIITSFTPATGPMGYGNVRISLALAQQQLATLGITNPTPEQLAAALNGGEITYIGPTGLVTTTTVRGVLEMRAAGMGWGQIAQANGTKLGPVISGLKAAHAPGGKPTGVASSATGTSAHGTPKGLTTAGSKGPSSASGGHAYGRGIVTGHGVGAGGVVSTQPGKGHAYGAAAKGGAPVSTASGGGVGAGAAGAAQVSTAHGGGNAYGQAKNHGKN